MKRGTRQRVPALVDVHNPGLTGGVQNQPDFQAGSADHRTHFVSEVPRFAREVMREYAALTGRVLTMIVASIYGQVNYLNPCVDLGRAINQIKLYNLSLEKTIDSNLNQDYLIRFVAKPSFEAEYAFQIEEDSIDRYQIKAILFKENLWSAKNRDSIQVVTNNRIINSYLVLQIENIFKKATNSAMARKYSNALGVDGVSYYFYRKSDSEVISCGECWSPSKNTPLFELVSICEILYDFTRGKTFDNNNLIGRLDNLYDLIE